MHYNCCVRRLKMIPPTNVRVDSVMRRVAFWESRGVPQCWSLCLSHFLTSHFTTLRRGKQLALSAAAHVEWLRSEHSSFGSLRQNEGIQAQTWRNLALSRNYCSGALCFFQKIIRLVHAWNGQIWFNEAGEVKYLHTTQHREISESWRGLLCITTTDNLSCKKSLSFYALYRE